MQTWIPHRDPEDPKVFYIYEVYDDEAAYTAHTETEHFQRDGFGDAIPRLAERQARVLRAVLSDVTATSSSSRWPAAPTSRRRSGRSRT